MLRLYRCAIAVSPASYKYRSTFIKRGEAVAEFEKRLACVIDADGRIARGYMIDDCAFDSVNRYTIRWKWLLAERSG